MESGVGKTFILNYFLNETFDNNVISKTSGSKEMNFNGRKIKFNIWDTAGHERFLNISKLFYSHSNIIILVCEN